MFICSPSVDTSRARGVRLDSINLIKKQLDIWHSATQGARLTVPSPNVDPRDREARTDIEWIECPND